MHSRAEGDIHVPRWLQRRLLGGKPRQEEAGAARWGQPVTWQRQLALAGCPEVSRGAASSQGEACGVEAEAATSRVRTVQVVTLL